MPARTLDEDFVLTVSDGDDISIASEDLPSVQPLDKKRKRNGDRLTGKSNKKSKHVSQVQDEESETDSTSEEQLKKDDAIDSDFEFDLGLETNLDTVEEFDGWGNGIAQKSKGPKKAVDIDEIIARRATKGSRKVVQNGAERHDAEATSETHDPDDQRVEEDSEESRESSAAIPDFEDDELLADDAFGAQAEIDADDYKEHESESDLQSDQDDDDTSVASPTAHPEDEMSGSDNEDEVLSQSSRSSVDSVEAAKQAAFFSSESNNAVSVSGGDGTTGFHQFSISRPLLRALTNLSFSQPTPIQKRCIPLALRGLDLVGSAQTGSGKTAAFLLPILERLLYRSRKVPTTRVIILMPTRELAVQCYNVALALARYTDVTFAQIVGGFSLREQEGILKKRPDVVIATPGRFIDHMRNSASFQVESIEILVLDEADRMLEDGFADELNEILKTIPRRRQTMLFSATMTETVDKLIRVGMDKPVRVSVDAKRSTVEGLVQEFVRLRPGREQLRLATLCLLCLNVYTQRTIVFFRQKKEAHRVRILFGLLGIKAGELHGSLSQEQRINAVNSFRDGKTTHLLATDLASRGLDIKNVNSVVNYEAPQSHEIYLHRVGRTARAGKSGRACTIAAEPDRKVVKAAVKSAKSQGARVSSRIVDAKEVDAMSQRIEAFQDEIEAILKEEKEEKALAETDIQISRAENIVKHEAEIKSRPKRTWFESEQEKKVAKEKGLAELNGVKFVGEKKKLSNKMKKRLDDKRERLEGRLWGKSKTSVKAAELAKKNKKAAKKDRKNSKAQNLATAKAKR